VLGLEALRKAPPVVLHGDQQPPRLFAGAAAAYSADFDGALLARSEAVLQGVLKYLCQDHGQRSGDLRLQHPEVACAMTGHTAG
jgi:hypothetical protein